MRLRDFLTKEMALKAMKQDPNIKLGVSLSDKEFEEFLLKVESVPEFELMICELLDWGNRDIDKDPLKFHDFNLYKSH